MSKFNVGDRIRVVNSVYFADELQAGALGTVHGVDPSEDGSPEVVQVKLDSGYVDPLWGSCGEEANPEDVWPFYADWVEPA